MPMEVNLRCNNEGNLCGSGYSLILKVASFCLPVGFGIFLNMYSAVHGIEPVHDAIAMQHSYYRVNIFHSVFWKIAGAGVSGPIPGPGTSVGGGGGADLPDGAGSLLSKYLLKSPASSNGRLPSRRTMLSLVS